MSKSAEGGGDQTLRLLGLAFAGADLLFEVESDGTVAFCLGAVEQITGRPAAQFIGSNWTEVVAPEDGDLLAVVLDGVKPGERQGPLKVALRPRKAQRTARHASLSVFRLPQNAERVSCALSLGGIEMAHAPSAEAGLMETAHFAQTAASVMQEAERNGQAVRLDLVEMQGLAAMVAKMEQAEADVTRRKIAAVFRAGSCAGLGAAEVATDRFALIRPASASDERLTGHLRDVAEGIAPKSVQLMLDANSSTQNLRAMRYALDRYIEDGPAAAESGFMATVERTARDTARFKTMLEKGDFQLAYQPVVSLTAATLHHFEALARFDADASPADTIRLAEELDLITDFDLTVVKSIARTLAAGDPKLRIAANISAISLMRPSFIDALLAVTASARALRPRLLLELTETHTLADLPGANRVLQLLRSSGHLVCLDDFGAGAASLDYLRHLDVDFVKIDGRYVQSLGTNERDGAVLKHIVALCRELKVSTIAEMVETPAAAGLVKGLGVALGQGWYFGKPVSTPVWSAPTAPTGPAAARRTGVVEGWG